MRTATVELSFSLWVACPQCGGDIDLADPPYDDEGYFSIPIFNNRWDEVSGKEVDCPYCKETFAIDKVEY